MFNVVPSMKRRQSLLTIMIVLVVASTWYLWWILPAQPLRTIRVPGIDSTSVYIAPDSRSLAYTFRAKSDDSEDATVIYLIPEVRDIAPAVLKHKKSDNVTYTYLAGGQLVAIHDSSGSWMIEIPSGKVRWHVQQPSGFWLCSDDGRIVVANVHFQLVVFDTMRQDAGRTLSLDANFDRMANKFQLNKSGRLLAMPDPTTAGRVILWDTIQGKELARFDEPQFSSIYHVEFSPDDTKVAAEGVYGTGVQAVRGVVYWDIKSGAKTLLTTKSLDHDEPGHLLFSDDGRQMRYFPKRWDVTVNPPIVLADELADADVFYVVSKANRYFKYALAEDGETHSDRWTMYASDSQKPIGSGLGDRAMFSKDSKWALFRRESVNGTRFDMIVEWLPIHFERTNTWLDVYSLESGKQTTKIPVIDTWAYDFPIEDRLWTIETSSDNTRSELILREWSCYAASPPWWLWLVTVGGVAGLIYEFRQGIGAREALSQSA